MDIIGINPDSGIFHFHKFMKTQFASKKLEFCCLWN